MTEPPSYIIVARITLWLVLCLTLLHDSQADEAAVATTTLTECPPNPSFARPFAIALVADPQIGWNTDGYNSERLFQEAIKHLQEIQPDFILVAGDLVQTPRSESQRSTAKAMLDSVDIPYHVIAGNHDVRNIPTLDLLNDFVEYWKAPSYWYTIRYYDTLFVMLDSNTLRARDDSDADRDVRELAREQLIWLQGILQESEEDDSIQYIVPIAHHPLALRRLDEDSASTNTPRTVRQELVAIYQSASKINHVFAGHFHDAARIVDGERDLEYITYPSTGVILGGRNREPSGFAILQVVNHDLAGSTTQLEEEYYGYGNMPTSPREAIGAGFEITFPKEGEDWAPKATICIRWTSTSMTPRVRLEYSIDDGNTWSIIADNVPNDGVFSWDVPFLSPADDALVVLLRISSMRDASIASTTKFVAVASDVSEMGDDATLPPTKSWTSIPTDVSTSIPSTDATTLPTQEATENRVPQMHTTVWGRYP